MSSVVFKIINDLAEDDNVVGVRCSLKLSGHR